MELDLPAIDGREEVAPDEVVHDGAKGEDRRGENRHDDPTCQQSREELGIA